MGNGTETVLTAILVDDYTKAKLRHPIIVPTSVIKGLYVMAKPYIKGGDNGTYRLGITWVNKKTGKRLDFIRVADLVAA